MTKPFLKWAGGKTKLLPQLEPLLPDDIAVRRHVEPFVGGGALFFSRAPKFARLSDVNAALINAYLVVQNEPLALIQRLEQLAEDHRSDAEQTFYSVREAYNTYTPSPDGTWHPTYCWYAAAFIYLNKTCFNGLHRVNKRGEFNVPMGKYANPDIVNYESILAASEALTGISLDVARFEDVLVHAQPNDFVYFDPPYEPVSETSSFASYAQGGFNRDDHVRLYWVFEELSRRGCKVMLSNSDTPFLRALYSRFRIAVIDAARSINSKGDGRGSVNELIVTNY